MIIILSVSRKMNNSDWKKDVRFISENENTKEKAIDLINKAIEQDSELMNSECLFGGLKEYLEDLIITIKDTESQYCIDLNPKSGEGHDFSFSIDKSTRLINKQSLVVGEVLPEPEGDEDY